MIRSVVNDQPHVWSSAGVYVPSLVDVDGRYLVAVEPFSRLEDVSVAAAFEAFTGILDEPDQAAAAAAFVMTYGWPELCRHGEPDRHKGGSLCAPLLRSDCSALDLRSLKRAAESLRSADDLARRVRRRQPWSTSSYAAVQRWPAHVGHPFEGASDPAIQRAYLAHWMTTTMRQCDVRPLVTWPAHKRPEVTYEVDGLVGLLVVEAVRRIAQEREERTYSCAVCASPVWPNRAPKPGEPTYCAQASCQRERQRLNQAARRARAKGETR